MVKIASDLQEQEEDLASYEEKRSILEEQKQQKTKALEARQVELSSMISAMVKLRELPPEAVIAMPGKLDETLQTARALGVVTHAIEEEAESLKQELHELDALEAQIQKNREAIAARTAALEKRQSELGGKIKERSKLQTALGSKAREEKEHIAKLTAKSENLQDLVDAIGKSEHNHLWEHESAAGSWKNQKSAGHHSQRSFASAEGHLRCVPGKIISHYGNTAMGAAFSKGVVIETRPETEVLAPFDGEVVFAGPFRDYGRMVILRHGNEYHTLLAGMDEINCTPGQFLLEGEPIGAMGRRSGANRLYVELRKDGKPVDPLPWFKG